MICSKARMTRAEGNDRSTSIPRPWRLKSSSTLNKRKLRPSANWSCMKSIDQTWLMASGTANGSGRSRTNRGFQHGIQPAQHGERQDHVAVLAAHIHVAQAVIGDVPDEVGNPLQLQLIHELHRFRQGLRGGIRHRRRLPGDGAAT